ncbi:MAG: DUF2231 domain-containing protein [Melioribacteraceae bacterium]
MEFLAELHPRIVHFPIAFFILYFIFETSGIIFGKDYLQKASFLILALGVLTALFSVLTGNQALTAARLLYPDNQKLYEFIELHEKYATLTLWYYTVLLIARIYLVIKKTFEGKIKYLFILLGIIGCILVYLTGIYGGDLVFKHGIGTQFQGRLNSK